MEVRQMGFTGMVLLAVLSAGFSMLLIRRRSSDVSAGSSDRDGSDLNDELERLRADNHRLQAEAEACREQVHRANENLDQYIYIVSHDLQEPLRMVLGFTQLLDKRYGEQLDADGREFVGLVMQSATKLSSMMTDLLTLSRIGREPIPDSPVNLRDAAETAKAGMDSALEQAGARLEIGELETVQGNESLLVQVFQRLLDNAVKFRGSQPLVIEVGAERRADWLRVFVRDNGMGIEPKFAERVFQPFQRLHTQEEYPGNGMGLPVVQRIVERHGGRVGVDSVPGEGASFWFELPIRRLAE